MVALLKGDEYGEQEGDIRFLYIHDRPVIQELTNGVWQKVHFIDESNVRSFMRQRFGIVDKRFKKKFEGKDRRDR